MAHRCHERRLGEIADFCCVIRCLEFIGCGGKFVTRRSNDPQLPHQGEHEEANCKGQTHDNHAGQTLQAHDIGPVVGPCGRECSVGRREDLAGDLVQAHHGVVQPGKDFGCDRPLISDTVEVGFKVQDQRAGCGPVLLECRVVSKER